MRKFLPHTAALWGLVLVQLSVASVALPETGKIEGSAHGNPKGQQVAKPAGAMAGDAQDALGSYTDAVQASIQALKNYTDMAQAAAKSERGLLTLIRK